MIEGMYISASGILPKATRQEAIANNLANMEVPGYKRDSMFLREMQEAKKRHSGDYPDWRINRFEGTWTDFDQAKLRRTGHMFDLAITGQGFFSVRTPDGIQFTRNGTFARNSEGILVNMMGHPAFPSSTMPTTGHRRPISRYSRNPRMVSSFRNREQPRRPLKVFRSPRAFSRKRMFRQSSKWSG